MIIYEATKKEFMSNVEDDVIAEKIYEEFRNKIGKTTRQEQMSWNNSMQYMYKVMNTKAIPDDVGIAIEYRLPYTSKRVDFMVTGENQENQDAVVIVELKQWQEINPVAGKEDIVKTYLGGSLQETTHPSYQAWSYAKILQDYNKTVQEENINIYPCAYMHNYIAEENDPILDENRFMVIKESPVFKSGDVGKLRAFIAKYVNKANKNNLIYQIDHGRIKPSKSLQDSLVKMLSGNEEFIMIDTQKLVYETTLDLSNKIFKKRQKQVLIVEGGPGTGKSVLAVNLLVKLTARDLVCKYVTKNSAPREVYSQKLQENYRKAYIKTMFIGSGVFTEATVNDFDVLLVDEAHRLNEKSGMLSNKGENQTKEIINAAKLSVFFIDEAQRVTAKDVGSVAEIIKFAKQSGAAITKLHLESQFRCNGSDGYLAWLDDVLGIRQTANASSFDKDYDFRIFNDPNELRKVIEDKNKIKNKARLLAGYCWEWDKNGKNNTAIKDIKIKEFDFESSWNLGSTSTWAIDPDSVKEIGCIHTSQGLEFDYVGVIIGDDLRYECEEVHSDYTKRAKTDQSLKGLKAKIKNGDEQAKVLADQIIRNTYRTLMTRGLKGCYVYCTNKALSEYLKRRLRKVVYAQGESGLELAAENIKNQYE